MTTTITRFLTVRQQPSNQSPLLGEYQTKAVSGLCLLAYFPSPAAPPYYHAHSITTAAAEDDDHNDDDGNEMTMPVTMTMMMMLMMLVPVTNKQVPHTFPNTFPLPLLLRPPPQKPPMPQRTIYIYVYI